MYSGRGHVCVCLSVPRHIPTLLHGPGCNLGNGRGCPVVMHYWADLQLVHWFRCNDSIAPNAKCQRVLVLALCLVTGCGAVDAGLMGLFEKRRFRSLLIYIDEYDPNNEKTWKNFNTRVQTMQELFDKFGLDANTADFTGHALALYLNDEYVSALLVILIRWHFLSLFDIIKCTPCPRVSPRAVSSWVRV